MFWLLGEHFSALFVASALGLVSMPLAAHALALRLGRRSTAIRDASDSLRIGGGAVIAAGLGAGCENGALTAVDPGRGRALERARIGAQSGIPGGISLCLLVFTLAAQSVASYVLSIATLGSIADGARGVANMSNADGELRRRAARLDDAGFWGRRGRPSIRNLFRAPFRRS